MKMTPVLHEIRMVYCNLNLMGSALRKALVVIKEKTTEDKVFFEENGKSVLGERRFISTAEVAERFEATFSDFEEGLLTEEECAEKLRELRDDLISLLLSDEVERLMESVN